MRKISLMIILLALASCVQPSYNKTVVVTLDFGFKKHSICWDSR